MRLTTVLLARHAEKPDDPNDPDLGPRGYIRAGALSYLFNDATNDGIHPALSALFATKPSKASRRPLETLQPLAALLPQLPFDANYKVGEEPALAAAIQAGSAAVVLIAWHHEAMTVLATALGVAAAPPWPGPDVFDRLWRVDMTKVPPTLVDLPQRLLFGDSAS